MVEEIDTSKEELNFCSSAGKRSRKEKCEPCQSVQEQVPAPQPPQEEAEELRKQLLRLTAEFDNYRKRVIKEKQEIFTEGKITVLAQLLSFVDVFDKALEMIAISKDIKGVCSGVELLKKEFDCFLDKEGVKAIECIGKKFDPALHEAVEVKEDEISDAEDGIIIKEIQKGYSFNGNVIRPAKVIVRKKSARKYQIE
ncbi:MAG: nucleotide exchange factor GrpE [Elusimicrobiota bacterium]|nr:nucleotide exchange factor GrpE [Elusimicrobiota bacterium]